MKQIPLTQGKAAFVDDEDFGRLNQWKWFYDRGYAKRTVHLENGRRVSRYMHQDILNTPAGMETDHANLLRHDNQKHNLRVSTCSQNKCNRRKCATNQSGFKGVTFKNKTRKYEANIRISGRQTYLGLFPTAKEAANAYDAAALKMHKDFARLNS